VLSRAVEHSGTVTSLLVPWNTCGADMSGVLGVQTASYLPFCFFNLLSPVPDVLYGFIGFEVPSAAAPSAGRPRAAASEESRRPTPGAGSGISAG
jgi:NhaC family Na+:H+ antiporter